MQGVPMLSQTILLAEHAKLTALANDLLRRVREPELDVEEIGRVRWQMTRELMSHLAKEDKILYPRLAASPDGKTADIAARFAAEMGDLGEAYRAYMSDWGSERIASESGPFIAQTKAVMGALLTRIDRENRHLYPLMADAPDLTATNLVA
jgi:hypothetical protein